MKNISSIPLVPEMKYHAHDWNIITKEEKEQERIDGLQFLSSSCFLGRCVEHYICSSKNLIHSYSEIDRLIRNRCFFVVITRKGIDRIILLIHNIEEFIFKLAELNIDIVAYDYLFVFINRIQIHRNCCAGVVFSSGSRELRIELMPYSVNTRDLTDGTKESSKMIYLETSIASLKVINGQTNKYITTEEFAFVKKEIVRCCYKQRGYYEFILGLDSIYDFPKLFFTYYSDNERYGMEKTYLWKKRREILNEKIF